MRKQTFHKYVDKLGKGILYDKHFSTLEEAISYVGATLEEDLKENFRVKKYVNSAGCQGYSVILKSIDEYENS